MVMEGTQDTDSESNSSKPDISKFAKLKLIGNYLKPTSTQVIALISLVVFLVFLTSSSIQLAHNNPSNIKDVPVTQLQQNQTSIIDTSLGITYNVSNEFLIKQIDGPLVFVPILYALVLPVMGYVAMLWLIFKIGEYCIEERVEVSSRIPDNGTILGLVSIALGMVAYHVISISFILEHFLPIYHLSDSRGTVSFTVRLLLDGQANTFRRLLLIQGLLLGFIASIWTRDIQTQRDREIHLNNWRQYGSWISTILGGVLITTGFVFVTDLTPYGNMFVRQILILFGGTLVLTMSFIVYKMDHLESKIG